MDPPHINVTSYGTRWDEARPGAPRPKHSAWFLTISTNKGSRQCNTEELAEEFHDTLMEMCERGGLEEIMVFEGKDHALSTHLEHCDARVVVETGSHPKGSRVHGHILLQVKHFSKVKLDRGRINDFIASRITCVPLESLYIHWKMVGYTLNIEEYMNKFTKRVS